MYNKGPAFSPSFQSLFADESVHLKLAVDEGNGLLAVLRAVAVVGSSVAAVAAVRVGGIAVGLDLAVVVAAGLAGRAGGELRSCQQRFDQRS